MAVAKRNSIIDAIRGHMGNVVFRVRNGIQEMYGMPKKSEKAPGPDSPAPAHEAGQPVGQTDSSKPTHRCGHYMKPWPGKDILPMPIMPPSPII